MVAARNNCRVCGLLIPDGEYAFDPSVDYSRWPAIESPCIIHKACVPVAIKTLAEKYKMWLDLLNNIASKTWRTQLIKFWKANPWLPVPTRTDHTIPMLIWTAWDASMSMDYLDSPDFRIQDRRVTEEYFLNYLKVPL